MAEEDVKSHRMGHRLKRNLGMLISENLRVVEEQNLEQQRQIPQLLKDIYEMCNEVKSLRGSNIRIMGSSATGLSLASSDIDFLIRLQEDGTEQAFDETLYKLRSSKRKFILINYVRKAKVPVISVRHYISNINCDLTFDCPSLKRDDVLKNTELLRIYAENCKVFKKLFIFIKTIFGKFKVFSAKHGGLSSYTHAIILIYYLVNRESCIFTDPLTNLIKIQRQHNAPLAEIFYNYLLFVRDELEFEIIDIIKIGAGSNYKGSKLTIIDPYLRKKDLARNLSTSNLRLLQCMAHEWIRYILAFEDKKLSLTTIKENVDYLYSESVSNC